jgi:EmrB/QacA subfamily drug resistance transporter
VIKGRLGLTFACASSLFVSGIDGSAVNLALPSVSRQFHTHLAGAQWAVDIYPLVLVSCLITMGALADRIGRRATFIAGLIVFAAGSAACSMAPDLGWLIGFRAIQAAGAAALNPVSLAIIRDAFDDPADRARATTVWTAAFGLGLAVGPSAGTVLVAVWGWRSVFWICVPVCAAALVLTVAFVRESRAPQPRRADLPGQISVTVLAGSLAWAVISGPAAGWTSPRVLAAFAVSAAAAAMFAWAERRPEPLVDFRLFRQPRFAGSALVALAAFAAFNSALFHGTFYLQNTRGYPAMDVGAYVLPMAGLTLILAPIAGKLAVSRGARPPMLGGAAAFITGGLMLARLGDCTSLAYVVGCFAVIGTGYGLVNQPASWTAQGAFPKAQAAVAAGIVSWCRQVGSTAGVASAGVGDTEWLVIAACGALVLAGAVLAGARVRAQPGHGQPGRRPLAFRREPFGEREDQGVRLGPREDP